MSGSIVVAMVLLGAFAIDRIVTALLFLLDLLPPWRRAFPDPALASDVSARSAAEKKLKLAYFAFAIPIGVLLIVAYPKALLLKALGITDVSSWADHLFTLLVLVGGADRISELLGSSAFKGAQSSEAPIRVTGTLTLEEGSARLGGRPQ